jgi:DNA-directed RNA polymerase subunit RPC12/RpoP
MASNGNCFICGKIASKVAMKNHVLKEHNSGDEKCYLIKAEGAYMKDYWLLFSIPLTANLEFIDNFLRDIWCECCGHMSVFYFGSYGSDLAKNTKISRLRVKDTFTYEYDMGSTTEISLTVLSEISRPKQKAKICLLARNETLPYNCVKCGKPADFIDSWEWEALCEKCSKKVEDECCLSPIVNSPRTGTCGYDGERDKWTFKPAGPFPIK